MAKMALGTAAALALATVLPAPAHAVEYVFNMQSGGTWGAGVCNGASNCTDYGNSISFSQGSGANALSVRVSAWSIDYGGSGTSDDIVRNALLQRYGGGFGVTNRGENGSDPNHAIDNSGRVDFLLFQFSKDVELDKLVLGWGQNDTDMTLRYGEGTGAWGDSMTSTLDNKNVSVLNALLNSEVLTSTANGVVTGERNVNSDKRKDDWWIVSALTPTDSKPDYFKLQTITVQVYPSIPEPSTWMTMILGFGAVGWGMRRRRRPGADFLGKDAARA